MTDIEVTDADREIADEANIVWLEQDSIDPSSEAIAAALSRIQSTADLQKQLDEARELLAVWSEVAVACDRFFREAMPKMNAGNSFLDANAVDAWNKAELAIAKNRARIDTLREQSA